jgi:hypothetical protein
MADPAIEAATVIVPAAGPRVRVTLAAPLELVTTLAALTAAVPEVTAKLTVTPLTPDPELSVTATIRGWDNAAPASPD